MEGAPHALRLLPPHVLLRTPDHCLAAPHGLCPPPPRRLLRILDRTKGANIVRVATLIGAMVLIAHWLACIW